MWNEKSRLTTKYSQYAMDSHKFKRFGPRDLEKVAQEEREAQNSELENLVRASKQDNKERLEQRKVEREVVRLGV